jgi:hypothetical protein
MYRLLQYERDPVDGVDFDGNFFTIYRKEFEQIKITFRALGDRIKRYKEDMRSNDTATDELELELANFLNRLYVFIGCAARFSHLTRQDID